MALTGQKNLPEYHTVSYDLTAEFGGGRSVRVDNSSVSEDGSDIASEVALPLMATSDNPFAYVPLTKLTGTFHVASAAKAAELLSVTVPQIKYEPGDTVKATISYLPFHAEQAILPVDFKLGAQFAGWAIPIHRFRLDALSGRRADDKSLQIQCAKYRRAFRRSSRRDGSPARCGLPAAGETGRRRGGRTYGNAASSRKPGSGDDGFRTQRHHTICDFDRENRPSRPGHERFGRVHDRGETRWES